MNFSLLTIFGAGLLTFVSPCVLPLMPIYLASIAGTSLEQARPRRTMIAAAAFALGLSLVFVLLGALASTAGGLLVRHRTAIVLVSGALMAAFGLRALGVLRVPMLDRDQRPGLGRIRVASNIAGAFVFGAAFALGWSPCIGPVLASVLTYAATHADSPWRGAGYLSVYAAGISLPLLVLAATAERATAFLRRFRAAIPVFEKVTGLALLVIGVWTVTDGVRPLLAPSAGVAMAASASASGSSCASGPGTGPLCDLPSVRAGAAQPLSGQPQGAHLLEFTAPDCPVCRRMRPVLDRFALACREMDAPPIVRVDVATPEGRALADRHGVRGTPTFVLFDDVGVERARLLGELTSSEVSSAVEKAFGISCDVPG